MKLKYILLTLALAVGYCYVSNMDYQEQVEVVK